jgi:predicted nucleic acid-binding protein
MTLRFLDTNILLYGISDRPDEAAKRQIADDLLDHDRNGLSVQVLQEFYHQATRPTRTDAISHGTAVALVHRLCRFPVLPMTVDLMQDAFAVRKASGYSYWDSAIIAAAAALGCAEVMTEDMQHNHRIAGVRIVNPFR